jgi:hypothetical protein
MVDVAALKTAVEKRDANGSNPVAGRICGTVKNLVCEENQRSRMEATSGIEPE